MSPSVP